MSQPDGESRVRAFLRSYSTPAGRQAFRNLVGLVICTGLSQGCALGMMLILTHGLSQPEFGAVIFALNAQMYLFAIGTFGLGTIVVRDLTQHPERAAETTAAYLSIVVVASTLVGVATAALAAVVSISWDERVMLWCVAAGNVAACLNLSPFYDAAHRQALAAALMVPGDLLMLAALVALLATNQLSVFAVAFVVLLRWVVASGLVFFGYYRSGRLGSLVLRRERLVRHLISGWPVVVAWLLSLVPFQGGVMVTRVVRGESAAAIYGLAVQAAMVYLILSSLVIRVIQPHVHGVHGMDAGFVRKLVLVCLVIVCGLWGMGVFAGFLLTRYALPASYGPAFRSITLALTAAAFSSVALVTNHYLIRFRREPLIAWLYAIAGGVFVSAVAFPTPRSARSADEAAVIALGVLAIGSLSGTVCAARATLRAPAPDRTSPQASSGKNT